MLKNVKLCWDVVDNEIDIQGGANLGTLNPLNAYKETKIKTASQGQLIIMLYDESIKHLDLALKALSDRHEKFDEVNGAIVKAQDIVTELMVSLDMDRGGEIAKGLFNLYVFFNEQLMEANMKKDAAPIQAVRKMMDELRASWVEISSQYTAEDAPAMGGVNIAG